MLIQPPGFDVKKPATIIQIFSDEELFALATFMQYTIDTTEHDMTAVGVKAAHTFMHLLKQWEGETQ